jgi:hypothetical protein
VTRSRRRGRFAEGDVAHETRSPHQESQLRRLPREDRSAGLAFENYDAISRWRTEEATTASAQSAIDSSGKLPDGRGYQNADEFKKLLLRDLDAFTLTFIEKLATYGLRRTTSFGDRDDLKAIAAAAKSKDYRLKDIIEAFVRSDLFQKR